MTFHFVSNVKNAIHGTKPAGKEWNRVLDAVVTIIIYKKGKIDHVISMKVLSDGTVYYLKVPTYDAINTYNNEKEFFELRKVFE